LLAFANISNPGSESTRSTPTPQPRVRYRPATSAKERPPTGSLQARQRYHSGYLSVIRTTCGAEGLRVESRAPGTSPCPAPSVPTSRRAGSARSPAPVSVPLPAPLVRPPSWDRPGPCR